jgi:hypothetical protein
VEKSATIPTNATKKKILSLQTMPLIKKYLLNVAIARRLWCTLGEISLNAANLMSVVNYTECNLLVLLAIHRHTVDFFLPFCFTFFCEPISKLNAILQ